MSKLSIQLDTDDALNPKFNAAALDFLLIELVPLAQRITAQVQARDQALVDEYKRSKIFSQQADGRGANPQTNRDSVAPPASTVTDGSLKDSTAASSAASTTSLGFPPADEEAREAIFWRLDGQGYRVGQGLVER